MDDSSDDDEVKLVMKKFCKLLRKKEKVEDGPVCYGCGEAGHIKNKCPKSGRNAQHFKRQRAYISWGGDSGDDSTDQDEDETANLCLMAHEDQTDDVQEVCLKASSVLWYLDRGCSKHMTGDASKFLQIKPAKGGNVVFGDNSKGKIIGVGSVGKKTKALKKKAAAEATSSAPQPFPYLDGSFLEFGSEEELSRFITYFAKRPISPPRVLPEPYPQQKGYYDLDNQLKESGLWPFVSRSRTSFNPAYIRAFYSNLRRDGDTIRSSINLVDFKFDLATFARVAGLPTRGDDIATYGGDDWILNNEAVVIRELGITNLVRHSGAPTIHSAPPEKRLLLYILTRIFRPRDGSHTCLFNEDLKAVHAITHGASINWAKYVMIHMADCASITTERSLPYAFLVMDLIKSGDQDGAGPSRAPASAPAKASLQSIADTLNRLTITVDGMGQYLERMDSTLQRQHHDMRAFFRGINYVPPPFDSTFLGQNYEGEDEEDNSYAPSSSPDEANFEDAVDGDPMDVEDDEEDDDAEDEDAAA
ncbi:unnamed protein product [Cuscuta campestris]|uniref:CCHC-type domain-containing protein n=1 Tax=Cuscuta campestris TaxID=132261 RepID=A0A484MBN4_9ASTE|nr:unnamed protein product [Cuscuta campestris]